MLYSLSCPSRLGPAAREIERERERESVPLLNIFICPRTVPCVRLINAPRATVDRSNKEKTGDSKVVIIERFGAFSILYIAFLRVVKKCLNNGLISSARPRLHRWLSRVVRSRAGERNNDRAAQLITICIRLAPRGADVYYFMSNGAHATTPRP